MGKNKNNIGVWEEFTEEELDFIRRLNFPYKIQEFLDDIPYNTDNKTRSPRRVMKDERAHCFEGAHCAASALRFHGYGCRILDMHAERERDDDHVIALFKRDGCFGAVAKSNFAGLRFREPIYKSLRELVMSYFNDYFNLKGERTLRSYSLPVDLRRFDDVGWMTTEKDLGFIGDFLDSVVHKTLLTPQQIGMLNRVDKRTYDSGLLGSNPEGIYRL